MDEEFALFHNDDRYTTPLNEEPPYEEDEDEDEEPAPDLRAGPWKSGYGEYPFADEIYDLTHPQEPDEYDDRYDGPEDYDEFDDEEPNPYHGTYSEE